MAALEASSPSRSSPQSGKYDIFLSFRGETRHAFTDHLKCTLEDYRFSVFIDKSLERGEIITDELKLAIEKSRMALIVFSSGYAESRWCLDELVKIMECRRTLGQMVFPIFYHVTPSDVRHQTGSFATAFLKHKDKDAKQVQGWKDALKEVADLSGEDLGTTDGHEGMFIRQVIEKITRKLKNRYLDIAKYPVGIDSRVQEISNYLDVGGSNDVRIIGIWGMGGLGKTTVGKAILNEFHHIFEGTSFLPDMSKEELLVSQNKLLSDILRSTNIKVSSVHEGTEEIKRRIGNIKVLVLVDDVDHVDQLHALAIKHDSFVPGSRVIITTRDKHLLEILKVDKICSPRAMNKEEALQLFSWHAFGNECPDEGYLELSRDVVEYCGGLPLALEDLGTCLCTRSTVEWDNRLHKWKRQPDGEIHKKLKKISYDGLTKENAKAIFLDISCFFIGMNKDYVMTVLDGCDFDAATEIRELDERCLVSVDKEGNLMMHDLIRDTGREIVRAKSPYMPGRRCRLWDHEDVIDVLRDKSGTKKIEGLTLDLKVSDKPNLSTKAFKKMEGLRLLKLNYVKLTGSIKLLSKQLRWLCWEGFPEEVIPEDFYKPNLVNIDLSHSHIQVWKDFKLLEKLKFLNLGYCDHLNRSPDFSKLPNLENLILEGCKSMSDVHHSIVLLKNLKYLSLANCKLKDEAIPVDFGGLSSLEVLDLRGNDFKMPPILSGLFKLRTLQLEACTNLQTILDLPKNLEILGANGCIELERLPDFSEMLNMRELHLNDSPKLIEIPGLDKSLNSMIRIHMEGCTSLTTDFRKNILQGWTSRGSGGIFLNANYIPEWFEFVDGALVCFDVPQSEGRDYKGLTLCTVCSKDSQQSGPIGITVRNKTKHTALHAYIPYASITTSYEREDHYLWQGQLSNDVIRLQGGDKIEILVGTPVDDFVKKTGVTPIWDKFLNENMHGLGRYDFEQHPYLDDDQMCARDKKLTVDQDLLGLGNLRYSSPSFDLNNSCTQPVGCQRQTHSFPQI